MAFSTAFATSSGFVGRQGLAIQGVSVRVRPTSKKFPACSVQDSRSSGAPPSEAKKGTFGHMLRSAVVTSCAVSAAGILPLLPFFQKPATAAPASSIAASVSHVSVGGCRHATCSTKAAPALRVQRGAVAMASPQVPQANYATVALGNRSLPRFTLRDRFSYAISEFLMWNSMARLLFLFATAIITIGVGGRLFRTMDPEGSETDKSPMWMSVRSYLNPMEDNYADNRLRVLSVTMAMLGTVYFGIFIGMVTEAVESGIAAADGGSSRVVAAKHTVILGYNSNTSKIISDINAVGRGNSKIVVLVSESEREGMMEELRDLLSEEQKKRVRISVRSGTPVLPQDLDKVAAARADKIILSAGRGISAAESDRRVLSRALALRSNLPSFGGDVIAELSSPRDEAILQSILKDTRVRNVEAVSAERLVFRFMAQAMRNEGLADCVVQMMSENPRTVFHVLPVSKIAPSLVGIRFGDIRPTTIPGAIICGYVDADSGKVVIDTTGSETAPTLSPKSELLVLGAPTGRQARIAAHSSKTEGSTGNKDGSRVKRGGANRRTSENILICGWRPDTMEDLLVELNLVLPRGSSVTIVDEDAPVVAKSAVESKLNNLSINTIRERPDSFNTLEGILGSKKKAFDRILLLSSALGPDKETEAGHVGVEEDSKALTSLCYINELLKKRSDKGEGTTVTIEFMNETVADIARQDAGVTNIILPHSLRAHIAAQTVRDSRLNSVWEELLSQEGREAYIRPAEAYLKPDATSASFATISTDAAVGRREIVVGFIPKDGEPVINPSGPVRFDVRTWLPEDNVIVLADE